MEIRRWHCYIAINCAVLIPCLFAKSVSLNDIIAKENPKEQMVAIETKIRESTASFPSKKPTSLIKSKLRKTKLFPSTEKNIPLQVYTKEFDIKNLLKPKKLKKRLHDRLNQSTKREINKNAYTKRKFNPLFRNLNALLDNIFNTNKGDVEITGKTKSKRYKTNQSIERSGMVCKCIRKGDSDTSPTDSKKKTIAFPSAFASEVSNAAQITSKTANNTTMANVSSIRSHKDVPLLLSRNTTGSRRNNHGHSERSSATLHRRIERNITRYNGNSKYNTTIRKNGTNTASNEEITKYDTRDDAGNGFQRGHRNNTRSLSDKRNTTFAELKQEKGENVNIGDTTGFKEKIQHEIGGNETKSRISLSEYDRGQRGYVSENKVSTETEFIQSEEDYEKSNNNVTHDHTDDKRIFSGSSTIATENQNVTEELETVISIKDFSNLTLALQNPPKGKVPVVTIFGGYSVARDINGPNKLSEQSIHIHS